MDLDQLKGYLRRNNLKPNFTYGQNFLIDDIALEDIVDAAKVGPKDNVLEIGPGIGNLTRLLCERAAFVLSIEKDPKFFPVLRSLKKDFPENFRYEIADALEFNFQETFKSLAGQSKNVSYKVVANIPYFITGKILRMLISAPHKPTSITILTQKEVANNLKAKAGDLGLLAISVQLYGKVTLVNTIPAKSFYPAPKVDSAIIRIDLYDRPKYAIGDEKKFFTILRACFAGKRKQLHNTLTNNLRIDKEQVLKILSAAKIKPTARPQELSIDQWIRLAELIP